MIRRLRVFTGCEDEKCGRKREELLVDKFVSVDKAGDKFCIRVWISFFIM